MLSGTWSIEDKVVLDSGVTGQCIPRVLFTRGGWDPTLSLFPPSTCSAQFMMFQSTADKKKFFNPVSVPTMYNDFSLLITS